MGSWVQAGAPAAAPSEPDSETDDDAPRFDLGSQLDLDLMLRLAQVNFNSLEVRAATQRAPGAPAAALESAEFNGELDQLARHLGAPRASLAWLGLGIQKRPGPRSTRRVRHAGREWAESLAGGGLGAPPLGAANQVAPVEL